MSFLYTKSSGILSDHLSMAGEKLVVVQYTRPLASVNFCDLKYCDVASKFSDVVFCKLVENEGHDSFDGIGTMPTFVFSRNNEELQRLIGPVSESTIEVAIRDLQQNSHKKSESGTVKGNWKRANNETEKAKSKRSRADEQEIVLDEELDLDASCIAKDTHQFSTPDQSTANYNLRATSTNSSGKRRREEVEETKSVSAMNVKTASRLFGLDIERLLYEEKHEADSVVTLRNDDLTELFECVYNVLCMKMDNTKPPHVYDLEPQHCDYVKAVIEPIVSYLKRNFLKIKDEQLSLNTKQPAFEVKLGRHLKEVTPDFLVEGVKEDKKLYYFSIVEVKRFSCQLGVKQLVIHMKECVYRNNQDKKPIYGFCMTGSHFNVVKYDPQDPEKITNGDFKIFETNRFLFAEMRTKKKDWLDKCTLLVRIMYSILFEKLNLNIEDKVKK